ncbi:MAG: heavy-metal-associated domain-containing protein [Flavobacteriia bacterium]|nr:heavy-metal-associated domain-containing protein [Flavobacteriia bacterium]
MEIRVEGMKCQGCVEGVTNALKSVPGIDDIDVSLEEGKASFTSSETVNLSQVSEAVSKAGFKVK